MSDEPLGETYVPRRAYPVENPVEDIALAAVLTVLVMIVFVVLVIYVLLPASPM